ncbi:lysophospholipid acyltransferase family protein [Paracoccus alkenifer]|uniref:KDO2-lipid IV(A) lauroyltransferase n=1 Tax=Paracoccus alkenifer TaxID=65735 RepID=A0A1H6JH01_9RHOB|nr:lysophospholipid acyltransferase family protein [Paracoccus alkenifer]SEH61580.1 KDO2-lipid IV(A) lauroyltransferase [Paracoccus alkenifer]
MAERPTLTDRLGNAAFVALMRLVQALPYPRRVALMGWLFAHLLGPLAGWRRRIRANLALACPDLPEAEIRRLTRAVPENAGRAMAETYSGADFLAHIRKGSRLDGPGVALLESAAQAGRPVVLAAAHFGNYDAMRAALVARGWPVGGLYRPMNNPLFNRHYVAAIEAISTPLFPRGRKGLAEMLKFLRGGGFLALGFDQHVHGAAVLRFFGLPAATALTPAELALRHDAPLVPIAAIRQPGGLDFRVHVGDPIPPASPKTMMQALNDDLESLVRAHMEQWLWIHRRWKVRTPADPDSGRDRDDAPHPALAGGPVAAPSETISLAAPKRL